MTPNAKVLEQACELLAMMASNRMQQGIMTAYRQSEGHRLWTRDEENSPVIALAAEAFASAYGKPHTMIGDIQQDWHAQAAEAEAMLRCQLAHHKRSGGG